MIMKESKMEGTNTRLTRNQSSNFSRSQDPRSSDCKPRLSGKASGSVAIPKASREVKIAMSSNPIRLNWPLSEGRSVLRFVGLDVYQARSKRNSLPLPQK